MKTLFENPKFWTAVIALLAMIITASVPSFHIESEQAVAQIVILVAYLYGVIVDPGQNSWLAMLKSRKFWAALIGEVAVWLNAFNLHLPYGISYDQIIEMVTAVVTALILAFAHTKDAPQPTAERT